MSFANLLSFLEDESLQSLLIPESLCVERFEEDSPLNVSFQEFQSLQDEELSVNSLFQSAPAVQSRKIQKRSKGKVPR